MTSLKQLATEALGVPSNILNLGNELYSIIVKELNKAEFNSSRSDIDIRTPISFNIGGVIFNKLDFTIEIEPISSKTPLLKQAGVAGGNLYLDKEKQYRRFKEIHSGDIHLQLVIGIPKESIKKDQWDLVLDYIKGSGKKQIISTLTHELKHVYDSVKMNTSGIKAKNLMMYNRSLNKTGLSALDDFNKAIYYTSMFENLVRPTEFAAELKHDGVTKKDFLQALKNSNIYERLKKAKNISFEGMMNDLLSNKELIESIKQKYIKSNKPEKAQLSDEELIDIFMGAVYKKSIFNTLTDYAYKVADYNDFEVYTLMGGALSKDDLGNPNVIEVELEQAKKEAYNDMVKHLNRYPDYKSFYKSEEKKVKHNADKVLRSLAKLYAYLD